MNWVIEHTMRCPFHPVENAGNCLHLFGRPVPPLGRGCSLRSQSSFHEYTFDCALMNRVQASAISKAENIPRTFQKYSCRNAERCSCSEMYLNTWNFLECKQVIFTFILTEVIHLYFPKISYFQKSFWNSFMATSTTTFLFQVLASTSKRPLKVLSGQGK